VLLGGWSGDVPVRGARQFSRLADIAAEMGLNRNEIEAVAGRVVELLRANPEGANVSAKAGLVDAATVARLLGVSRATVYAKADQLGAIRLGSGRRARLRFDPARLVAIGPGRDGGRKEPAVRPSRRRQADRAALPIRGSAPGARQRRLSTRSGS
jgi:hypothetical protein